MGGGQQNTVSGFTSSVVGGQGNQVNACHSNITSGLQNIVQSNFSIIGSGSGNTINNQFGGILGGCSNVINNDCSFIVGYGITTACPNTTYVNCLNIVSLPTEASLPLPTGTLYRCTSDNSIYSVP